MDAHFQFKKKKYHQNYSIPYSTTTQIFSMSFRQSLSAFFQEELLTESVVLQKAPPTEKRHTPIVDWPLITSFIPRQKKQGGKKILEER